MRDPHDAKTPKLSGSYLGFQASAAGVAKRLVEVIAEERAKLAELAVRHRNPQEDGSPQIPPFLSSANLKPHISELLTAPSFAAGHGQGRRGREEARNATLRGVSSDGAGERVRLV